MTEQLEQLRRMLSPAGQRIVVVSHTNPDGDAIGSSLALRSLLESMGHQVCAVVPNRYPSFLNWMAEIDKLRVFKEDTDGAVLRFVEEADLIFCLDFNQLQRLERLGEAITSNTRAKRILIDHHLDPPPLYDLVFSSVEASSTALMVFRIIAALAGTDAIDYAMAESMYVGMMTDTGNFSFSNLTPELYRAVALLIEKGINIPSIHALVYNNFSEGRMRLLGHVLSRKMEVIDRYGVALITLKESELRRFDFQIGDSEGFVNYPLSIRGIDLSAMFLQTRHFIRVSLRSRGDVDVNVFGRRYFDGGGHKNAAGGKSFASMEETIEKFRTAVAEFMPEKPAERREQPIKI